MVYVDSIWITCMNVFFWPCKLIMLAQSVVLIMGTPLNHSIGDWDISQQREFKD